MPKPESEKRTENLGTWVTAATAARVRAAALALGWTPCQLVRQAVEVYMPDVERAAALMNPSVRGVVASVASIVLPALDKRAP